MQWERIAIADIGARPALGEGAHALGIARGARLRVAPAKTGIAPQVVLAALPHASGGGRAPRERPS